MRLVFEFNFISYCRPQSSPDCAHALLNYFCRVQNCLWGKINSRLFARGLQRCHIGLTQSSPRLSQCPEQPTACLSTPSSPPLGSVPRAALCLAPCPEQPSAWLSAPSSPPLGSVSRAALRLAQCPEQPCAWLRACMLMRRDVLYNEQRKETKTT